MLFKRRPSIPDFKQCSHCRLIKHISSFQIKHAKPEIGRKYTVIQSWCNLCLRIWQRGFRRRPGNHDRIKKRNRSWWLRNKYGMTTDQYDEILRQQKGGCAICGSRVFSPGKYRFNNLAADHDHKTERVRGLLCNCCNIGLSNFKDNPKLLRKAIRYLTKKYHARTSESDSRLGLRFDSFVEID